MAKQYIVVPIRLEVKYLAESCMATSPLADYTQLPWSDGSTDYHFDIPFLGDSVIHHPFENKNLTLPAGIHLHFVVPHYLGMPIPDNAGLKDGSGNDRAGEMPAAPNTWLVTKKNGDGIIAQWIIESDYIYEETDTQPENTCVIPYLSKDFKGRPFRFMGRTTKLGDARPAGDTFKSLYGQPLTVLGPGDHNFSSFYPNCMGVFGFHDPDGTPNNDLSYSFLGWNSEGEDDLLFQFLTQNASNMGQINDQLNTLFQLDLDTQAISAGSIPRSVFFGSVTVDAEPQNSTPDSSQLNISIGNTGTEALSALLSQMFAQNDANLKSQIEDQLESMLLFSKLDHLLVDTGPKFLEARHEKGFHASKSGHIWKLVTQQAGSDQSLPQLPPELAGLLHQLNQAQFNYDNAAHQINSLKEQLYLDWCKYMQAAYPPIEGRGQYPDPDHVRYFIQNHSFVELKKWIASAGSLTYGDSASGFKPVPGASGATDLANDVLAKWNDVNQSLAANQENFALSLAPRSRFWEPNAPVVLIAGLSLDPSSDEMDLKDVGEQLTSLCLVTSADDISILSTAPSDLQAQCDNLSIKSQKFSQKFSTQVWNPFILEWEADLFDTQMDSAQGDFDPTTVIRNFDLDQFGPDFVKDANYQSGNLSVFSGSVIMSPNARRAMLVNIQAFIAALLKTENVTDGQITDFLSKEDWNTAYGFLGQLADANILKVNDYGTNPLFTAWSVYQKLLKNKVISQTLNGFNQACIMRRKTAQFPIVEPLGFEDGQNFTQTVGSLVQTAQDTSPITAFDFNPIRSGAVTLNRLCLIDNFGISADIDTSTMQIVAAETLRDDTGKLFLPPRISQPARLNFRWLSAEPVSTDEDVLEDSENSAETNDHPDTSPVCGWLVANYLDNTLAVFDADGNALGYLDANAAWNLQPWVSLATNIETNIPNGYLRNVVKWLANQPALLQDFLAATQVALDNVAPANANQYTSQALLMGRPMAVVRARVSFELKGLPALDQSWSSMLIDLTNCDTQTPWSYANRHNKNWTQIKFPVRIGEHHQLNDGLLGYWAEDSQGNLSGDFEAPETDNSSVTDAKIDTFSGKNFQTQQLSIADEPLNLTLLMDPRGVVHLTSGLLPTKAISIPPEHYLPAFKKIGMWFYTSPILQPNTDLNNSLRLNLPAIPGYTWQWWDKFSGITPTVADDLTKPTQGANTLIEGWLSLNPQPDSNNSSS